MNQLAALRARIEQLDNGSLTRAVGSTTEKLLLDTLVSIALGLDFAEHDVRFANRQQAELQTKNPFVSLLAHLAAISD
jgi:hypothetical protein